MKRSEAEYVGRRTLEMEVPGRRKRGRPRKRWLDVLREDMESVGVMEEDVVNRRRRVEEEDALWRPRIGKAERKRRRRRRIHFCDPSLPIFHLMEHQRC